MIMFPVQEDVQVARWLLEYVLDDAPKKAADDEGKEAAARDPDQASDEDGGSPRAPL